MKTQKLTMLTMLLAVVIFFSACEKLDNGLGITGQGPMIEEIHHLDEFQNIEVDVNARVYLTQDQARPILIRGQANILNNLTVNAAHGTLRINYLEKVHTHEKLEIHITLPVLNNLSTARGALIKSQNAFGSNHLNLQVYGAGKINMEIAHANRVSAWIKGNGKINLRGEAELLDVVINGPGSLIAPELTTTESNISITGQAHCEVFGSNELHVNINGNGKVLYTGNPVSLQSKLTGNGELRQVL